MKTVKLSLLICSHIDTNFLDMKKTLESIFLQKHVPKEIIILKTNALRPKTNLTVLICKKNSNKTQQNLANPHLAHLVHHAHHVDQNRIHFKITFKADNHFYGFSLTTCFLAFAKLLFIVSNTSFASFTVSALSKASKTFTF